MTSDITYFAVGKYDLAGGAVVTASHNPGADNGIKLYRDQVIAIGLVTGRSEIREATLSRNLNLPHRARKSICTFDYEDW